MNVLVTGGAGFLGSHCVDALIDRGHQVTVVDDFSTGTELNLRAAHKSAAAKNLRFEIKRASVGDAEFWASLGAYDAVLHLAGNATQAIDPRSDFELCAAPVVPMLEWVRRTKVKIFILGNEAEALYGDAVMYPSDERSVVQPVSTHGATKAFFELYLASFVKTLKAAGEWSSDSKGPNFFSWLSLRIGSVYGPRQSESNGPVAKFVSELKRGHAPVLMGDGKKSRDYVHVADVTRACMLALDRLQQTAFDEAIHIGTGVETKDLDLFNMVVKALERCAMVPALAAKLGKSLSVKEPALAPLGPGETLRSTLNIGKADAFLGWAPEANFEDGVEDTIRAEL